MSERPSPIERPASCCWYWSTGVMMRLGEWTLKVAAICYATMPDRSAMISSGALSDHSVSPPPPAGMT